MLDTSPDHAFDTAAQGRLASLRMRTVMTVIYGVAAALVLQSLITPLAWFAALQLVMVADSLVLKYYLGASGHRRGLQPLVIASAALCIGTLVAFGWWVAMFGGEAGKLLAGFMLAGLLVGLTAYLHGARSFMWSTSLPPALGLVVLPFLPRLGEPEVAWVAGVGVLVGMGGFANHIQRAWTNTSRMLLRAQAAGREAIDGRAEAEARRNEAERANRAKSEVLANMSHELRTPLNAVIGYAEILEEELSEAGLDGCTRDAVRIRTAGRQLLHLINDLLDLSKIEAGRMELAPETFEIEALAREAVDMIAPAAQANGNTIKLDLAPALGSAHSDAGKIRQALLNLLANAAKFTKDGSITVSVRRETTSSGDHLMIVVADTGIGMTRAQIAALFEPFTQADSSIVKRFGGTGLGLAITRRLIQLLGGDIAVRSVQGEGSSFTLRVPTVLEGEVEAEVAAPAHAPLVLIIDDESTARDLAKRAAAKAGLKVLCADTAATGLALARRHRPALVVLDIQLPDGDGMDVLSALRADPTMAATRVLIVSNLESNVKGRALGADEVLMKPVGRDQLCAVMQALIAMPKQAVAA